MSQQNLLKTLIESLTEKELYELAQLYLKNVDDIANVFVCNGPWDSGIDLATSGYNSVQYQATVEQKKIETKIISDVIKAKQNSTRYSLPKSVKYFYSHNLSNYTKLKLRKEAKENHDINLIILDANELSQAAIVYETLSQYLYEASKLDTATRRNEFFDTTKAKAFYDLMSFGSSTDIKYSIIKSFVLNLLIDKIEIEKTELLSHVNTHFNANIDISYFNNFLQKISSEQKIKIKKTTVEITEDERSRIEFVLSNYQAEKNLLLTELQTILDKYDLDLDMSSLLSTLTELYESNYSVNLEEFTNREFSMRDLKSAKDNLIRFIRSSESISEETADEIAKELIITADGAEILSRIAIGQVYSKVSDPKRLEQYVSQNINNKKIFIDTNVLIYLILIHYEERAENPNLQFRIAKQFLDFSRSNSLLLKVIRRYSIETSNIFKDAKDLVPFTKLEIFKYLGKPGNIVYQHYSFLKDNDFLSESSSSFENFLKEFRFTSSSQSKDSVQSTMEYLLGSLNIEIEEITEYDIQKASQIITEDLSHRHRRKSFAAINNDAIMFRRLGDRDVDTNPLDPIFCTWDYSLFSARKNYFDHFSNCTQWFQFTPSRLMDHFAMMRFQVKPGSLSNEVLSLVDQDISMKELTHSLLDSITLIINPSNDVGLKYTNKLGELRKSEILEVEHKAENVQDSSQDINSVDAVLSVLILHFLTKDSENKDAFKELFTKELFIDEVVQIIKDEKDYFKAFGKSSESLIPKMSAVVKKSEAEKIV